MNYSKITTYDDFKTAFMKIGLNRGVSVILHASLSQFGYIVNGASDIIDSVLYIIGEEGTVLVSTNTGNLTDPEKWENPSVPKEFIPIIKEKMKTFDPKTTPPWHRGRLAETFLLYDGVYRSNHPIRSITAKGKKAKYFTETHPLHDPEGENSPLYKLYKDRGYSLLLGVNSRYCSIFHVAESIVDPPYLHNSSIKVLVQKNEFIKLEKYSEAHYFNKIEDFLIDKGIMKSTYINGTRISLINNYDAVNLAIELLMKDNNFFIKE